MSIARHLDALGVYHAMAIRVVPVEGDPEDLLGDGGGLEETFDRLGQRPLLEVLRDVRVRQVLLADGELTIEAERVGSRGRLRVRWGDRLIVNDEVEIPPAVAATTGPLFRPDPASEVADVVAALHDPRRALHVVEDMGGQVRWFTRGLHGRGAGEMPLRGQVPAIDPATLGSSAFRAAHSLRWAYVAGDMAGGISSVEIVLAMARAGLIGFFGAGGLPLDDVERALVRIREGLGEGQTYGINLLHNPAEPEVEEHTVDLYLKHGVRRVSASAYMDLTAAIVRYRLTGIRALPDGSVDAPHHVFAKVSRPEVAERFLRPAPAGLLRELREKGALTELQTRLAERVPLAMDITGEADSGGHTDRRPLVVLLGVLQRARDRIVADERYEAGLRPRIGAAGGLGTPSAVWAAFAMGADYVLTGSVNQAAVEAGTSRLAKQMLGEASFSDVTTGPAPDMFELGANVQVLSRGTLYAQRAQRLYELYRGFPSLDDLPAADRQKLEKQIFRRPIFEVWEETRAYWQSRDPRQIARAEKEPRHQMALTFRWYLGMTSRWARVGDEGRKRDFQMWCGPAMGAFNEWVASTPLADLDRRTVVAIADALMYGAAAHARVGLARAQGLRDPMILVEHLRSLGMSNRDAREALRTGKVALGGVPVSLAGRTVDPADVTVNLRAPRLTVGRDAVILHRDPHLAVVWKPAGMLSVPAAGRRGDPDLMAFVGRLLGAALPVHRLDEHSSGVMVVALTARAQALLKDRFAAHRIERRYLAIVQGEVPEGRRTVDLAIVRDRGDGLRGAGTGGIEAVTHLERVERLREASLVRATLETGRTHQVRIHLAALGHPVLGDPLYGNAVTARRTPRQALHAEILAFEHPFSKQPVRFWAPLADDLESLRQSLGGSPRTNPGRLEQR
jgi:RluA family pseudouridine synthase